MVAPRWSGERIGPQEFVPSRVGRCAVSLKAETVALAEPQRPDVGLEDPQFRGLSADKLIKEALTDPCTWRVDVQRVQLNTPRWFDSNGRRTTRPSQSPPRQPVDGFGNETTLSPIP